MPIASPHPCARPGCACVVPRGTRYCPEHTQAHRRADDERRGSAHSRGYDADWRRFRAAWLARHPLCVVCEADNVVRAGDVVDHIVSIADAPGRRLDPTNVRTLCSRHHNQRTGRDQAWGRGR